MKRLIHRSTKEKEKNIGVNSLENEKKESIASAECDDEHKYFFLSNQVKRLILNLKGEKAD